MSLRRLLLLALMPALMVAGAHVMLQILADWFVLEGRLIGPDAYMRVLRVMELGSGGAGYDPISERSNAPFGETLHWTRPLDLLLLLGGALGAPLAGFDTALFVWAALIGPTLHMVTIVVLLWVCRPLFDQAGIMLLGLLFAVQFFISFQFAVGRPDHHGLNTLLFIWQMGFALRLAQADCAKHLPFWAAMAATAGLWISIEGTLGTALILAALAAAWIVHGGDFLRRICWFLVILSLGLLFVLLLERPPGALLALEYDRLSVVHLALFGLFTLCVLVVGTLPGLANGPIRRFALAAAATVLTLGIMLLWLPDFHRGPMAAMDPLVYEVWFRNNAEVSPVLKFDDLRRTGPKFLAHLGLVLLALPAVLALIFRRRGESRLHWLILGIFLVAGTALALREARWMGYPQALCLPPCIALLQALFARFAAPGMGRAAVRVVAVIILATGPLIGGGLLRQALPVPKRAAPCELPEMSRFLAENYADRPHTLLNFIYSGPELLYHTPHFVVATPYHRNTAGIVDTINFLRSRDGTVAQSLIKKRQIDLVLICPGDPEADNYRLDNGAPTLFMRLEAEQPPPWLTTVPLPEDLAGDFKLFRTSR
ncbi:MAG: hypothetical protein QF384_17180 [Alphaproteobacteria bacterium]|jgi:hypothetical protein|nr:hypothetical protein [Alphaproteobacteria bacterium]